MGGLLDSKVSRKKRGKKERREKEKKGGPSGNGGGGGKKRKRRKQGFIYGPAAWGSPPTAWKRQKVAKRGNSDEAQPPGGA